MRLIFFCISLLLSFEFSLAASVTQVKGSKVLISIEGIEAASGTEVYVLDNSNKKIGLLAIRQVKGSKAIADLLKGRAVDGAALIVKSPSATKSSGSASSSPSSSDKGFLKKGKNVGGVLVGLAMNSLALTIQNVAGIKEDAVLKDMSFNLKAFYDYDFMPELTIRGAAGLETFSAKGSTKAALCDNGTNCGVSFNYLAFEGSAHYNFLTGKTKAWVGLGYSFLVQMSKASNIPNLSSDSSTNQEILISAGADFWMNAKSFIPVVVEYGTFPGSANVVASSIYVRSGYGLTF